MKYWSDPRLLNFQFIQEFYDLNVGFKPKIEDFYSQMRKGERREEGNLIYFFIERMAIVTRHMEKCRFS